MNAIKNLYLVSLIFALFIGIFAYKQKNNTFSPIASEISISKAAEEQLNFLKKEEVRIYTLLENDGIKKELVEKEKAHHLKIAESNSTFYQEEILDKSIKNVIQRICKDFNINIEKINIQIFNHPSPAGMDETTLFINPTILSKLSMEAKYHTIAHEFRHYVHKDSLTKAVVEYLYTLHGRKIDYKDQFHPYSQLSRFCELRADIEAATKNDFYAQCYKAFAKESLAICGDSKSASHPQMSFRLSMAEKLNSASNTLI